VRDSASGTPFGAASLGIRPPRSKQPVVVFKAGDDQLQSTFLVSFLPLITIMSPSTAFILGATGFVGGHLLQALSGAYPDLRLRCLLRNPSPERVRALLALNSNVEVVEGSLEDTTVISSEAESADLVINVASSDHISSVEAILAGLQTSVEADSSHDPIYLHMSGLGIIADNVRGERVEVVREWSDLTLSLDEYDMFSCFCGRPGLANGCIQMPARQSTSCMRS
jgi:hypothetical protein